MEKDVVVCHHCHSKVHIVDFCNNKAMMMDSDYEDEEDEDLEMDAIEQMQGEEFAMWMGVGDNLDAQKMQIQTNKELNGVKKGMAREEIVQTTVSSEQLRSQACSSCDRFTCRRCLGPCINCAK